MSAAAALIAPAYSVGGVHTDFCVGRSVPICFNHACTRTFLTLLSFFLPPFPNSIKRIMLKNFMTHKLAEIRPSSRINFLLGHNGTGKSSIVCAICLCLGGEPHDMDRSPDLGGYIMTGAPMAMVTIELQGPGDTTITVSRSLLRGGGVDGKTKSKWHLDGKETKPEDLKRVMHRMNIMVGNPTQFLPQERVGKFSEAKAPELLKNTLLAISSELHTTYMELGELNRKTRGADKSLDVVNKDLEEARVKKDKLAGSLKQWEAHNRIERDLRLVETVHLLAAERDELKAQAELASSMVMEEEEKALAALGKRIPALAQEVHASKAQLQECTLQFTHAEAERGRASTNLRTISEQVSSESDGLDTLYGDLQGMENSAKGFKATLRRLQKTEELKRAALEKKRAEVEKYAAPDAAAKLKEQAARVTKTLDAKENDLEAARDRHAEAKRELAAKEKSLKREDDMKGQRFAAVRQGMGGQKWANEVQRVEEAIARGGVFKGKVAVAPVLTATVLKPQFIPMVESVMVTQFSKGLVALDEEDIKAGKAALGITLNTSYFSPADCALAKQRAAASRARAEALRKTLDIPDLTSALDCVTLDDLALTVLVIKGEADHKFITGDNRAVDKVTAYCKTQVEGGPGELKGAFVLFPAGVISFFPGLKRGIIKPPLVFVHNVDVAKAQALRKEVEEKRRAEGEAGAAVRALDAEVKTLWREKEEAERLAKKVTSDKVELKKMEQWAKAAKDEVEVCERGAGGDEGMQAQKARVLVSVRAAQCKLLAHANSLPSLSRDLVAAEEAFVATSLQLKYQTEMDKIVQSQLKKEKNRKEQIENRVRDREENAKGLLRKAEEKVRVGWGGGAHGCSSRVGGAFLDWGTTHPLPPPPFFSFAPLPSLSSPLTLPHTHT